MWEAVTMVAPDAAAKEAAKEEAMPAGYPSAWEFDGLLRNGETAVVRPIRPSDAPALVELHGAVSPGTLHQHVLLDGPALSMAEAARSVRWITTPGCLMATGARRKWTAGRS
jgi:hypothetical protein